MCAQAIIKKMDYGEFFFFPFLQVYPFNKNKSKTNMCAQWHRIYSNNFGDSVLID